MLGDNLGQFYTYSEMVEFLDSLHTEFPSITTDKDSIGTTWEGRTIWAMKISDSPDLDEEEPEVVGGSGQRGARSPCDGPLPGASFPELEVDAEVDDREEAVERIAADLDRVVDQEWVGGGEQPAE